MALMRAARGSLALPVQSGQAGGSCVKRDRTAGCARAAAVALAPLALAVLELFHPHPDDLMAVDVPRWLLVHYAQIPLFALSACAVAALLRHQRGAIAWLSRIALLVFACSFIAFDTAAGVVTGLLVSAARESGHPDSWRPALDAVWLDPIVGGMRQPQSLSLSSLGAFALALGTTAAAMALYRAGRSLWPALLLAGSGFGIIVFHTHAWPGGPLTFGGIALASAWLEWEAARAARPMR
jgi:hypothetical protein